MSKKKRRKKRRKMLEHIAVEVIINAIAQVITGLLLAHC